MKCPQCQCEIETPQMRWQRRMRARGRCVSCGGPTEKRAGHEYAKCLRCRRKAALQLRRRRDPQEQRPRVQVYR